MSFLCPKDIGYCISFSSWDMFPVKSNVYSYFLGGKYNYLREFLFENKWFSKLSKVLTNFERHKSIKKQR